MKPTEIRIKIAEVCGWKWGYGDPTKKADGLRYWSLGEWKWPDNAKTYHELPGYESDLNAMHEAEKTLTMHPDYEYKYGETLARMTIGPERDEEDFAPNGWGYFSVLRATAAQRAEAFLKTLELWEDDIPANS